MKEIIKNKAVRFYLILTIIVFLILLIRDFSVGINNVDWDGIWTEAHGMWFDIIILGVLLAIYDHFRDKKENEEIAITILTEVYGFDSKGLFEFEVYNQGRM